MNPIAEELNSILKKENPYVLEMLSHVGKNLFFPKGLLTQAAEAKKKAHKFNATIGIAKEKGRTMRLDSVAAQINDIPPREFLTYSSSFGIPELRKLWQKTLFQKNPSLSDKNISLPVICCGVTHAISTCSDMWLNKGDVVILPDMMWGNYNLLFSVKRGVRLSHYQLFTDNMEFNVSGFEHAVRAEAEKNDKIAVVLNFPHNPSGYTPTEQEGGRIVEVLTDVAKQGTNVLAFTDDSYFGLFYEKESIKESLFARLCGKHPRLITVKLDGATKENFAWGLRVGCITYGCCADTNPNALYDALERKSAGCVRGTISNTSHLGQTIILRSMQDEKIYNREKKEKFEILEKRANRFKKLLKYPEYKDAWDVYPFNSGYFLCLRLKTVDAETLRVHLLDEYGVGLISIGKQNLRIAFSCIEEADLSELLDIIFQGITNLTANI
jgi:aspartate/methionine/tyrosine aminotransferase